MDLAQPDVQFTHAADGVAIAYWEVGSGPPLVLAQSLSISHAELEWSVPSMRALYLELAKHFRLVRFDPRGSGMSDEAPIETGFSISALCLDLDAVVNALDLDEFNLAGAISMGPVAIRYAVEHPQRVSRLMLFDTGPVLADMPFEMFARAQTAAGEHGVPVSFGAITHSMTTEDLVAVENLMKTSMGRGQRTSADVLSHDVADLLGGVTAPTMVVRSRDSVLTDQEQTRRLVTGITGAQMRVVSGTLVPFIADLDAVAEAFVSFLTSDHYVSSAQLGDELRTVVFTDLVSSTEVLSRLGDDEGRAAFRDVETIVSKLCSDHHGRLIKHLGDGSLISFKSTQRALAFGLELQQQMDSSPLGMRVGMAAGEPIQQDDDIHGAVVVQASRIADVAQSGEIVVADSVRQLAIGKGFSFAQVGEVTLKGFDQPTSIWKVAGSRS